jgi:hypothetical protein
VAAVATQRIAAQSRVVVRGFSVESGLAHSELRKVGKPTAAVAAALPREYNEMPNEVLLTMGASGDQQAREELLVREVMHVDKVSWDIAEPIVKRMSDVNRQRRFLLTIPHKAGITLALGSSVMSVPMIFDKEMALWFNDVFVTTEVPPPEDLETVWEIGQWTWNWMEPPLGEISFVLLALQFARAQMQNIGWRPYTAFVVELRANRLCKKYPTYNRRIVHEFSVGDTGLKTE